MRVAVAKFKSTCNGCQQAISKGDGIVVDKKKARGKRTFCSHLCAGGTLNTEEPTPSIELNWSNVYA